MFGCVHTSIVQVLAGRNIPSRKFTPMNKHISLLAFYGCAVFYFLATFAQPRFLKPGTEATLTWDVSGYYMYLPAIFIYHDLDDLKFMPALVKDYEASHTTEQAYLADNGKMVMKYSVGMAVLYSPFFFLSHAVAIIGGYPTDGFSLPYQVCIHLGSVLFAIMGLWFLRKNLLHYFSEKTTALSLVLVAIGTNLFNYGTFDAANAHGYLFALMAALVHFTIRWHEKPNIKDSLMIGLCIGLAALVRPTEMIYALVPILWGISTWRDIGVRLDFFKNHFSKLLLAALMVVAIGFIQIAYWRLVAGDWLVYSYQNQGFSFLHPHLSDVLLSYRKGWFVYTPLMLFAVAGLYFLYKNQKALFPVVFIYFLINTWIVSAWDIWWYGGGFGQRAMIQSYPLLAFPLAAFLAWAFHESKIKNRKSKVINPLVAILLAACVVLNLFQTYQAHWGPFETEAMNKAYYWRIFAKTKNDPWDRLLLDTKEDFSGTRKNVQLLQSVDFESFADSTRLTRAFAHSPNKALFVDAANEFSPLINLPKTADLDADKWLHISAWFYSPQLDYQEWWMPQLVVRFEKNDKPVRERNVRPFRVLEPNEWLEVGVDIKVPRKEFDNIEIFLWNPAKRVPMYMDDLRVEVFGFL